MTDHTAGSEPLTHGGWDWSAVKPGIFAGSIAMSWMWGLGLFFQDFPMLDSVPSTTGTLAVFSQQTLFWRIVRRDIKPHIVEMRRQPS